MTKRQFAPIPGLSTRAELERDNPKYLKALDHGRREGFLKDYYHIQLEELQQIAKAREGALHIANAERQIQGEALAYQVRLLDKEMKADEIKVAAIIAEVRNRFSIGKTRYYQIIKKQK